MQSPSEPSFVVLRSGVSVPFAALVLLWELENHGLSVEQVGELLAIGPRNLLTDDDRVNVRRHRESLRVLVAAFEAVQ